LQYDDPQYIKALRFLSEDQRVGSLGLCNFDTKHMENIISNGVKIYSNQVQVSEPLGTPYD
jgi:diketogulonate reductase-like aldo/keto reductase